MRCYCKTCFTDIEEKFAYCPWCGEPTGVTDDKFAYKLNLDEARAFTVLGRYADARRIYDTLMTDEPKDAYCLIGLVRIASKNYTVYDDPKIEKSISQLNDIVGEDNVGSFDKEYNAYLAERSLRLSEMLKKREAEEAKRRAEEEREKRLAAEREKKEAEARERERVAREKAAEERAHAAAEAAERVKELAAEKAAAAAAFVNGQKKRLDELKRMMTARLSEIADYRKAEAKKSRRVLEEEAMKLGMVFNGSALTKYSGNARDVYIPSFITSVANGAFSHNASVRRVVIHSQVTNIAHDAFAFNGSIEELVVEEGNTKYYSVDSCIIERANRTLVFGCKNSVIPSDGSVKHIGGYAFWGCSSLERINVPSPVESLGSFSFAGCSILDNVELPDSLKTLGSHTFYCCSRLKNISLPKGVSWAASTLPAGCHPYVREKL